MELVLGRLVSTGVGKRTKTDEPSQEKMLMRNWRTGSFFVNFQVSMKNSNSSRTVTKRNSAGGGSGSG